MPAYKFIITFILVLSAFLSQAQTTIPGGYVSGVWDSVSGPYIVEHVISVHPDSSLFIDAGVTVYFSDTARLDVYGHFSAVGVSFDSVYFLPQDNYWNGIRIYENDSLSGEKLQIIFCCFDGVMNTLDLQEGGGLYINGREQTDIQRCSFNNNYVDHKGAAIYTRDAAGLIRNCHFENNTTGIEAGFSKGGAVFMINSDFDIESSGFYDNEAIVAGAVYGQNSSMEMDQCRFVSNSSGAGGGAFVGHKSGIYTFDYCEFENNYANGSGGALALLEGIWARFRNCTFTGNTSETEQYLSDGGAVLLTPYDNEASFTNCRFTGNGAGDFGGAVYATSSSDFIGCLFQDNHSSLDSSGPGGGGAIVMSLGYNEILSSTFSGNTGDLGTAILCEDAGFSLLNCIIWDDDTANTTKIYLNQVEENTSVYVGHSNIEGGSHVIGGEGQYEINWADGNMDTDPLFEVPGTDFSLSNESPCIDTGRRDTLNIFLPLKDIAGNPRIYRDKIDLGCYENQFPFALQERISSQELLIYPNPARDYFCIQNNNDLPLGGVASLSTLSGLNIILDEHCTIPGRNTKCFDIGMLPSGMYIFRLQGPKHNYSSKIIL